jgi:hypothetical protein
MTQYIIKKTSDISADNAIFVLKGFKGTAPANQKTVMDFYFPQERWISGIEFYVKNAHFGDTASFHICRTVDGQTEIVYTFGDDAVMHDVGQCQVHVEVSYPALVRVGYFIRIEYDNHSADQASEYAMNIDTHIPIDAEA